LSSSGDVNNSAAPQLTWTNIISGLGLLVLLVGGGYAIIDGRFDSVQKTSGVTFADLSRQIQENRDDIKGIRQEFFTLREEQLLSKAIESTFADLRNRIAVLETAQRDLISHAAHSPVEASQVQDLSHTLDSRLATMQGQIDDINKQIAASIIPRSQQAPK
jgi:predicted  nucleic acid-binding Zn-ribbon protein